MELLYVTSNQLKYQKALAYLEPRGIKITAANFDFVEIQSKNPEDILNSKLNQAFAHFALPVLVSDDTWNIPALRGFPGPYMKDLNTWFEPSDWLRLMKGKQDKRIFLEAYIGYQDSNRHRLFHYSRENVFLSEPQGEMLVSPHLTVIGKQVDGPSLAAQIEQEGFGFSDPPEFWDELATWLLV